MSYILVVNPVILSGANLEKGPVMTATALSAAFGSLVIGVASNTPLGLMPGMGLNAYFTYGLCKTFDVSWQEALSCCFVSGVLLLLLAVAGVCQALVRKVLSDQLKKAITVAIGLFQALIGFQTMGLIVSSEDTLVTMTDTFDGKKFLSIAGLCAISALIVSHVHGALLFGIFGMAAFSWLAGMQALPAALCGIPQLDAAFCLDFSAWHPNSGKLMPMAIGTLVLLFVALFDIAGVQFGLLGMARLLEDGKVTKSSSIFASAGVATMLGAVLGTSPVIIANESSAGIMEGAKTGLSSLVVAALFLL